MPLTAARPEVLLDGVPLGPGTVSPDGRKVSIVLPGDTLPTPDRLGVKLSGRLLDRPPTVADPVGPAWSSAPGRVPDLGFDPGLRGPHPIRVDNYAGRSWKFAGLRRNLEMKGHVVAPSDPTVAAAAPLVLFLHGRHSTCYRTGSSPGEAGAWPCGKNTRPIPSDLGYDYLQRILASRGFVTVSIAANGINGQDGDKPDGGANARAALVHRHLRLWAGWVASGRRQADLDRVVLVGHSRGGEGVNRAAATVASSAPYRIAGQILLAPTDFARQTAAYVPTVTVLPYCDGDVSDLQGQAYTDNSIGLAAGDSSLKSSVTVFGANHNYFNTEWTPGIARAPASDDMSGPPRGLCGRKGRTRLSAAEQRRVARSYVAGAVLLFTGEDSRPARLFDGSAVRVGPVEKATVVSQSLGGGKLTLLPGSDLELAEPAPGARICAGYSGRSPKHCGVNLESDMTPHWPGPFPPGLPTRRALELRWSGPGRSVRLDPGRDLDLSGQRSIDLRVIVDPRRRAARLGITLIDADGARIRLSPQDAGRINAMPSERGRHATMPGRYLARTLRAPLPQGAASPGDLGRVRGIVLTGEDKPACGTGCGAVSHIWVLDLSAVPETAPPAPAYSALPRVRLRGIPAVDGGPGVRTLKIPFRVSGEITDPHTRLRVLIEEDPGSSWRPAPVLLPLRPGQRAGTVTVPYRGSRGFFLKREISIQAYPIRGAIAVGGPARASLKFKGPRPRLRVRPVRTDIRAGRPLAWKVRLTAPTASRLGIIANFARVPGRPAMKRSDLSRAWLRRHSFGPSQPAHTPLPKATLYLPTPTLPRRPGWVTIRIPTAGRTTGPVRAARLSLVIDGFRRRLTPVIRVHPG